MKKQNLNGEWNYRIGHGAEHEITVPFSTLPVGHSECSKTFHLAFQEKVTLLKFDGITYAAKVFLNGCFLGEMGPYSEYTFDVSEIVKEKDNQLRVELEDIEPKFGPTEGWENFGGIIRDVSLLFADENYITDVFFHSELKNEYRDAALTVETTSKSGEGTFHIELSYEGETVLQYQQEANGEALVKELNNVHLWSPDTPCLYELKVTLQEGENVTDTYCCNVGFREFRTERHRFLLNGEPLFLKGVCKHEMIGDSGHCPTEQEMLWDMIMIKSAGCNFVRLVHYPHNKKILDIADKIGLMVSEEPGLWWSNTAEPEVSQGSLEVLRRTILRDRNRASIVFWLCFNECMFTEQFLLDSTAVCRQYDPTRLVSGANCMTNEDTLKYYNICGYDFYTMHPYSPTFDRARTSAEMLHDKPLLFTEWGGWRMHNNPALVAEFMEEMADLYYANSDEGALAGACFWEWAEMHDFNRGARACMDGVLKEGLVDRYRNPNLIYESFCNALKQMGENKEPRFHIQWTSQPSVDEHNMMQTEGEEQKVADMIRYFEMWNLNDENVRRRRHLKRGPILHDVKGFANIPSVVRDHESISLKCDFKTDRLCLLGMTDFLKGYPLGGSYGEAVATVKIVFDDGSEQEVPLRNGKEVTTVFALHGSSRIHPVAEHSKKIAEFGYDWDFEQYIMNELEIETDAKKTIRNITITSANNGYALLVYGVGKAHESK